MRTRTWNGCFAGSDHASGLTMRTASRDCLKELSLAQVHFWRARLSDLDLDLRRCDTEAPKDLNGAAFLPSRRPALGLNRPDAQ
jgi:hypothetical protein